MTPKQIALRIKARHEEREQLHDVAMKAGYIAGKLPRAKNPPKLEELLLDAESGPKDLSREQIERQQRELKASGLWPTDDDASTVE